MPVITINKSEPNMAAQTLAQVGQGLGMIGQAASGLAQFREQQKEREFRRGLDERAMDLREQQIDSVDDRFGKAHDFRVRQYEDGAAFRALKQQALEMDFGAQQRGQAAAAANSGAMLDLLTQSIGAASEIVPDKAAALMSSVEAIRATGGSVDPDFFEAAMAAIDNEVGRAAVSENFRHMATAYLASTGKTIPPELAGVAGEIAGPQQLGPPDPSAPAPSGGDGGQDVQGPSPDAMNDPEVAEIMSFANRIENASSEAEARAAFEMFTETIEKRQRLRANQEMRIARSAGMAETVGALLDQMSPNGLARSSFMPQVMTANTLYSTSATAEYESETEAWADYLGSIGRVFESARKQQMDLVRMGSRRDDDPLFGGGSGPDPLEESLRKYGPVSPETRRNPARPQAQSPAMVDPVEPINGTAILGTDGSVAAVIPNDKAEAVRELTLPIERAVRRGGDLDGLPDASIRRAFRGLVDDLGFTEAEADAILQDLLVRD
jgi:hypothetical protein